MWVRCLLEKAMAPHSSTLPGKSHGWRSLVGCSPWGRTESDTTERLHFHFSLSCIGDWNGNPLQCSCLEDPRDSVACWAAVYGVAQSRTRLKQLSSSSSRVLWKRKLCYCLLLMYSHCPYSCALSLVCFYDTHSTHTCKYRLYINVWFYLIKHTLCLQLYMQQFKSNITG